MKELIRKYIRRYKKHEHIFEYGPVYKEWWSKPKRNPELNWIDRSYGFEPEYVDYQRTFQVASCTYCSHREIYDVPQDVFGHHLPR